MVCEGDPEAAHRGFTARKYRDLLQEHLGTVLDHDSIFMQDNASIHTAHIVGEWLDEHAIQVMDWPPYSPDLNPIENIWALLKQKIYELRPDLIEHSNIAMLSVLQETAIEAWESLEEEVLNNMAISMRKRCQAVIDADGWYTKY